LGLRSIYLRLWFGAKPFESPELDSLAQRMSVLQKMDPNPKERWYVGRGYVGYSTMNRVFFGSRMLSSLNDSQRIAVAAHELVHIREGDTRHALWRISIPSYMVFLGLLVLSTWAGRASAITMVGALVGLIACLAILTQANAGWRRAAELRCDVVASSFIDGRDLIEALRIQNSFISPKLRKSLGFRFGSRLYPSQAEREEAILRVVARGQGTDASAQALS